VPGLPERWLELVLARPQPSLSHLYGEALRLVGARGMRTEGAHLVAVFPAPNDPSELTGTAAAAIRSFTGEEPTVEGWTQRSLEEQRAIWRASMRAWRISERVEVVPAGGDADPEAARPSREPDAATLAGRELTIRIQPSPAFGAGDHPTTRVCLRLLERTLAPGDEVVDVGTGSGILAIGAALLGASRVRAFEADALAHGAAAENVLENRVGDRVKLRHARVGPGQPELLGNTIGALANLETALVLSILPDLRTAIGAEGWMIVSGIPGGERSAVRESAESLALDLHDQDEEDGWWGAVLRPRAAAGRPAKAPGRDDG